MKNSITSKKSAIITNDLYYTAPSDKAFNEIKEKSIQIWKEIAKNDPYESEEKINSINKIDNFKDNAMYIVAMFDMGNQLRLASLVSPETRKAISDRVVAGGNSPQYNMFKQ